MNRNDICPAFGKIRHITDRLFHHQMHIKNHIRHLSQGGNHTQAKRKGWHKHTVHHINMKVLCASLLYQFNFFSQSGAVSGQD